jgi:hypothetical protein
MLFKETIPANNENHTEPINTKFRNTVKAAGTYTVHRPGDDPRKECEECGNARGSNVRYYPT